MPRAVAGVLVAREPGARQVELPRELTHAGSLVYVARRLSDGSFEGWLADR